MKKISLIFVFIWMVTLGATEVPSWNDATTYQITAITEACHLHLNDGSVWDVGYWWEITLATWSTGDKVQISVPFDLAYYSYRLDNLTKKETIWGRCATTKPEVSNSDCRWIHDIFITDDSIQIKTNQGLLLKLPPDTKKYWNTPWQAGDALTMLLSTWPGFPAIINQTRDNNLVVGVDVLKQ